MTKPSIDLYKHLTLNGKVFSYMEILNNPVSSFNLNTPFEKSTIHFAKVWLEGKGDFLLNTSGSTGKPKEIKVPRALMIKSAKITAATFGLKKGDRILINLNTKYIAGMMMMARGFHLGLEMDIVEPTANPVENMADKHHFYAFVPLQLQRIVESGSSEKLSEAKAIIVGGAPISVYQENLFKELNLNIYHTYGMTETCTHVAIRKIGKQVFKALKGVSFEASIKNTLIIDSPTAIINPLETNDVISLLDTHSFIWQGRLDNIVNTGGVKVQIEELERKIDEGLNSIHQNQRFIITSRPDETLGQKIVMIAEKEFDVNTIERLLEKYERPREYHYLKEFPLTPTGKIDRKKIEI